MLRTMLKSKIAPATILAYTRLTEQEASGWERVLVRLDEQNAVIR